MIAQRAGAMETEFERLSRARLCLGFRCPRATHDMSFVFKMPRKETAWQTRADIQHRCDAIASGFKTLAYRTSQPPMKLVS